MFSIDHFITFGDFFLYWVIMHLTQHVCLSLGNYTARDSLRDWQDKNHPWLELTDVHRETTENMRVTVMPFYIGSRVSVELLQDFKTIVKSLVR